MTPKTYVAGSLFFYPQRALAGEELLRNTGKVTFRSFPPCKSSAVRFIFLKNSNIDPLRTEVFSCPTFYITVMNSFQRETVLCQEKNRRWHTLLILLRFQFFGHFSFLLAIESWDSELHWWVQTTKLDGYLQRKRTNAFRASVLMKLVSWRITSWARRQIT